MFGDEYVIERSSTDRDFFNTLIDSFYNSVDFGNETVDFGNDKVPP